jgi:RNA-binding protein
LGYNAIYNFKKGLKVMTILTKEQLQRLRNKAQNLKPVVITGNKGITETVLQEIDRALFDHELIKIRINAADQAQRMEFATSICQHTQAVLVQTIGHIVVIYRKGVDVVTTKTQSKK